MAGQHPSGRFRAVLPELLRFGVIGGLGYASDVLLFLLLRGPCGPITAKAVSLTLSTAVAFLGNRSWTFRERRAGGPAAQVGRETAMFLMVNLAGALLQLACVWISHYPLGLTSPGADLVSGSVVGMSLATALRFWGTRALVFRPPRADRTPV
ncbi:GtrA family protein [Kitasatospora sp. NPDC050543]|uniref:GtrA family protein n=1 Tax=Kitasatospora sp. NPDC050543 TaxID=3364054 RepID=UPI0037B91C02